jgi:hypothetical protein
METLAIVGVPSTRNSPKFFPSSPTDPKGPTVGDTIRRAWTQ